MTHYFKAKLESVIDRGTKMSNQELADLVDEKVGNEEKEPDMKLWKKNPQLGEVSCGTLVIRFAVAKDTCELIIRSTGLLSNGVSIPLCSRAASMTSG